MNVLPHMGAGTAGLLLWIALIFLGIILSVTVQLILLRIAMVFPPIRYLVRSILNAAER